MNVSHSVSISDLLAKRTKPTSPLSFLAGKDRVLIYGAGNVGKELLKLLTGRGLVVYGFLDGKLNEGTRVGGLEVFRPDSESLLPNERSKYCVIIGIFNIEVDIVAIQKSLVDCGYETIVTFLDLYRHFSTELGNRFWLTNQDFYSDCEPFLNRALSLWQDEMSQEIFKEIVNFRCSYDYSSLPTISSGTIYFDATVPSINSSRFIDCGAYDGDTISSLHKHCGGIETIAAFEPDLDSFHAMSKIVSQSQAVDQVVLFPCGVWSHTTKLSFSSGKGPGSCLSASGETTIQCVSLDDVLKGFRPTYIKMDIEGAEYEALLGAERIIKVNRPALAISLYHKPEHLWQIPLLLSSWELEYTFFLRVYQYLGFDLVMYAIPT